MKRYRKLEDFIDEISADSFNTNIEYVDFNNKNEEVIRSYNLDGISILKYINLKYSERLFGENLKITAAGRDIAEQLKEAWEYFISSNADRFGKIISMLIRNYNPFNNYEGHSTLTDDMAKRESKDDFSKTKTTNTIGSREGTNKGYTAAYDNAESNLPTQKTDSHQDEAVDKMEDDAKDIKHTEEAYIDKHMEYKWGNLGTATVADMVLKEQKFRGYSVLEYILVEFLNDFTIY